MTKRPILLVPLLLVGGCAAPPASSPSASSPPASSSAVVTPAPGTPGGLPDDRTPLVEPKGPIDPKSPEAAGQLVQRYGGLLEQRKFGEAWRLWGGEGAASGLSEARFAAAYAMYSSIHSQVGKPFDEEGAAGSIYIQVPFQLSGTLKSGGPFNLIGAIMLRRVNGVDGATPAQLRWHVAQSDLKAIP